MSDLVAPDFAKLLDVVGSAPRFTEEEVRRYIADRRAEQMERR